MTQVDNLLPQHIKLAMGVADNDCGDEIDMAKVPFSKNTVHMEIKNLTNVQTGRNTRRTMNNNKENVMETFEKASVKDEADEIELEIVEDNRSCTPTNETGTGQPLTPTANLKMLFNAMSPELRHRDELRRETSDEDTDDSPPSSQQSDVVYETVVVSNSTQEPVQESVSEIILSSLGSSRKDKSLGLLCQKFLQKYPEYPRPDEKYEICLDGVAKELQVERRRIYDIVNVLESVEIVSRVAKNKYAWHGKTNLHTTLAKLKALGDSEGFSEQLQKLKNFEFNRELDEQLGRYSSKSKQTTPDFSMFNESSIFNQAALRKDKSLGIMSQKFLMLFLVSKPKTVNLDLSAKVLIGDANIDRTESAKFKTKIRRLYDIANILTSLELIRKVHVTEIRGRKPAFRYVGPDIDNTQELQNMLCCSDGCHRPSSRHSMLDCIRNQKVAKIMSSYKVITENQSSASDEDSPKEGSPTKSKLARHSSFEQICAVAERERNKLYASASQPTSPTEKEPAKEVPRPKLEAGRQFIVMQAAGGQFRVVDSHTSTTDSSNTNKLPTKGFVRKKAQPKIVVHQDAKSNIQSISAGQSITASPGAEPAIIIKTTNKGSGMMTCKSEGMIPLSRKQIDAVLRSLKVPVPMRNDRATEVTASHQVTEPVKVVTNGAMTTVPANDLKEMNEKTPVVTVNNPGAMGSKRPLPAGETISVDKRIRLEFPSPPSSGEDKSPSAGAQDSTVLRFKRKSNESKPSPQRALHLTPEFNQPREVEMTASGDAPSECNVAENGKRKPRVVVRIEEPQDGTAPGNPAATSNTAVPTNTSCITMQMPNQQQTVLQLPIMNVQGQNIQNSQCLSLPQGLQIIQGADGKQYIQTINGQPIVQSVNSPLNPRTSAQSLSIGVPATFSPPLTPSNTPSSPGMFTFPTSNFNVVQPKFVKVEYNNQTLIRPVPTKPVSPQKNPQIVPPQLITSALSPGGFFSTSPGGFVPISSPVVKVPVVRVVQANPASGDHIPTAQQDISALS